MLKRLSLRMKMILMVFPLLLGALTIAGLLLKETHNRSVTMAGVATVADSISDLGNLIHNTQLERGMSGQFLAGKLSESDLKRQREAGDKNAVEVHKMFTLLLITDTQKRTYDSELNSISAVRSKVDSHAPGPEVTAEYSKYIENLIRTQNQLSALYPGTHYTDRLSALVVGELAKESLGRTRASYSTAFLQDQPISLEQLGRNLANIGGIACNGHSPITSALPKLQAKFSELFASDRWLDLEKSTSSLLQHWNKGHYGVDGAKFFTEITAIIEDINSTLKSEAKSIVTEAETESKKAKMNLVFLSLVLGLSVLSLAVFGFVTAKGIVTSLEGVVSVLTVGAGSIEKATTDIGAVSSNLSSSTHEQAAALHETMASIQYIGTMIARNSENAKLSEQVATKGDDGAQHGQQAVNQMITAISEISSANTEIADQIESSNIQLTEIVKLIKEIGNKTKVINDIVFQTKLLSFNASVEAARAGEYGKGFAVVAEEVGNLAQMSGAAAKEISQMLDGSIAKVEKIVTDSKGRVEHLVLEGKSKITTGTLVAQRCGDSLTGIVANVAEVKRLVTEISEAGQEQTLAMGEITKAVAQLEVVTQNNTTAATNAESANQALSGQTNSLNAMVKELEAIISGHGKGSHLPEDGFDEASKQGRPVLPVASSNSAHKKSA